MDARANRMLAYRRLLVGAMLGAVGLSLIADSRPIWGVVLALLGLIVAMPGTAGPVLAIVWTAAHILLLFLFMWFFYWLADGVSFWNWSAEHGWLLGVYAVVFLFMMWFQSTEPGT